MTAAATKPRAKAAPVAPAYTRPVQTFFPEVGKTAEERLAALRATLQAADEKLEAAYDAAERGSAVDTLLDLIAHDLLCTALHPVLRNEDEAAYPVTKSDLAATYEALFPVLAALEGAMALAVGTVLSATLAEVFNLLDWAQTECDSAALGALLPGEAAADARAVKAPALDAMPSIIEGLQAATAVDAIDDKPRGEFDEDQMHEVIAITKEAAAIMQARSKTADCDHLFAALWAAERAIDTLDDGIDAKCIRACENGSAPLGVACSVLNITLAHFDDQALHGAWRLLELAKDQLDVAVNEALGVAP
ncbi:MAG: hypothetical protein WA159_17255 [Variovorax sp.]